MVKTYEEVIEMYISHEITKATASELILEIFLPKQLVIIDLTKDEETQK